jgi:hypothetical protein
VDLFIIFKNSLLLPKKEALFRLNRVSMRNTLTYIVCLMFLLFLPDVVKVVMDVEAGLEGLPKGSYITQVIVFYPLFILFIVVTGVSLLAALSLPIKEVLGRKLAYHQLWKMTTFAMTVPLIIYTVLKLFHVNSVVVNLLQLIILYFLIYKMILVYPKRSN